MALAVAAAKSGLGAGGSEIEGSRLCESNLTRYFTPDSVGFHMGQTAQSMKQWRLVRGSSPPSLLPFFPLLTDPPSCSSALPEKAGQREVKQPRRQSNSSIRRHWICSRFPPFPIKLYFPSFPSLLYSSWVDPDICDSTEYKVGRPTATCTNNLTTSAFVINTPPSLYAIGCFTSM